MKRILAILLMLPFVSRAQVFNPVPDMIFKGQLSAGRSIKTDTSAYMSIGPARGANRGLMAPMVSDTNVVIQPRRHGLLIFSLQRSGFLYWDSTAVRWRDFGGVTIDTLVLSTRAWRQKGIDSVASLARVTSVFAGLGMKFDTIKTSGPVSVDTVIMATRPRVQKAVDSLAFVKQDKITLTTLGTTGPATLAGNVLNIPNYSPGSGFLRVLAPIGTAPNANGMTKAGDTLRLQPASASFGGVVTTTAQTFAGEKVFDERLRVGSSGGGMIQKTDQFSVGVGVGALSSSIGITGYNTAVGQNAGRNNASGTQNVFVGVSSGDLTSTGQPVTSSSNSVFVGMDARPAASGQTNQVVIGYQGRGNGSNTTTLGNASTVKTFVNGKLNVSTIDSTGSSANLLYATPSGDIEKTGRVGVSLLDTSVIGTRAWRQKGVDSLNSVKQDNLTLTTTGSSGASTLVGSTLNVPNYTLSGLGGVPTNRFLTINGVSYDLSADRVWNISVGGGGTVTSVAAGVGMNFSTITTTGTVNADTLLLATRAWRQKGIDSVINLISNAGGGTVLSVSAGTGMSFPTITSTGSVNADTAVLATRPRVQKAVDSLSSVKQNNISFTTTGSSGASTFVGSTLNVPNYTLSGLGGVPTTRTVTINGTAQDLSADRSWSVGTVTSVAAGTGMNFSTITGSGTVSADTASLSTRAWRQKGIDSVVTLISNAGGGTVLSVSAGTGMSFPTITSNGSVNADTSVLSTRAWRQKGIDSVQANVNLKVNISDTATMLTPYVRSTGTNTYIPKFNPDSRNLSNSAMYDSVGTIKINKSHIGNGAANNYAIDVNIDGIGGRPLLVRMADSATTGPRNAFVIRRNPFPGIAAAPDYGTGFRIEMPDGRGNVKFAGNMAAFVSDSTSSTFSTQLVFGLIAKNTSVNTFRLTADSLMTLTGLAGTGTRYTRVDANGKFSAPAFDSTGTAINMLYAGTDGVIRKAPVPAGGGSTDSLLFSTRAWRQKGIDSVVSLISSSGGGSVLSVAAGTGMSFPTITSSGTVNADTSVLSTRAWRQKATDSLSAVKQDKLTLTTLGNSGLSTLIGSTLNVPGYTLSGLGGVPTTRTLTINGVTYDLSQDRAWTISGGGGGGGGTGTVTAVNTGYGLLGGPITTFGTLLVDTNLISTRAWRQKLADSLSNLITPTTTLYTGNGTLTSNRTITSGGFSLTYRGDQSFIKMNSAGTQRVELTNDGLYSVGTSMNIFAPTSQPLIFYSGNSEAGRFHSSRNFTIGGGSSDVGDRLFVNGRVRVATIDSTSTAMNMLYADANGVIKKAAVPAGGGGGVSGSGTLNYVAKWTPNGTTLGNSQIFDDGTNVGISTTSATQKLDVNGRARIRTIDSTSTAINMLYAGSDGVIRKTSVPQAGTTMDSTSLTVAAGWNFSRDVTWQQPINEVVRTSRGDIRTVVIQVVAHRRTDLFTTGSWVTVASVPAGWTPSHTVYGAVPNLVEGLQYENQTGTDFAGTAYYEGACAYRILTNGSIQVNIGSVTSSVTLNGVNHVIIPLQIVYILPFIPL